MKITIENKYLHTEKKQHLNGETYYICSLFFFSVKIVKHYKGGWIYERVTPKNNLIVAKDIIFKTLKEAKESFCVDVIDLIYMANKAIEDNTIKEN